VSLFFFQKSLKSHSECNYKQFITALKSHELYKNTVIEHETPSEFVIKVKKSLLPVLIPIRIHYNKSGVSYFIDIADLLNISLVIVLFTGLLSDFSFVRFLILSVVMVAVFMGLNIWFIRLNLTRDLQTVIQTLENSEINLSQHRTSITNQETCIACGAFKSAFEKECNNCQISLLPDHQKSNLSVSNYRKFQFVYWINEKN